MLHCLKFQLQLRFISITAQQPDSAPRQHLAQCTRCREKATAEILTDKLLSSMKQVGTHAPPPDFFVGVQRRIRTIQAQQNSSALTGWEGVILQFQRLILSGAAAAALCIGLLAYAQSNPATQTNSRESALESYISPTQGDRMIITRSDPISQDDVLFALVTEDSYNARQ